MQPTAENKILINQYLTDVLSINSNDVFEYKFIPLGSADFSYMYSVTIQKEKNRIRNLNDFNAFTASMKKIDITLRELEKYVFGHLTRKVLTEKYKLINDFSN